MAATLSSFWQFYERLFSSPRDAGATTPTCILISITTSSPTLSKSDPSCFSISLSATTDTSSPITVDPEATLFETDYLALCQGGLAFRDAETGVLASRPQMNICRIPLTDDIPRLTAENTVEIPPLGAEKSFTVTHHFKPLTPIEECDTLVEAFVQSLEPCDAEEVSRMAEARESGMTPGEELQQSVSQAGRFGVGRKYEVGLGDGRMERVRWWRVGRKGDVFAGGRSIAKKSMMQEEMRIKLVQSASFEVLA